MQQSPMHRFITFCAAPLGFVLMGCGGGETAPDELAPTFGDQEIDFGQPASEQVAYPEAVGWEIGRAIPNLVFVGYASYLNPIAGAELRFLQMSDFYNPTGSELFPEDAPYGAGLPKPTALLLDLSAVWCGPCKYESEVVLPAAYAKYAPQGGGFLTLLLEGNDPSTGEPATYLELESWAKSYGVETPLALDPVGLAKPFLDGGWPTNVIIRTRDMKMIFATAGVPELDAPSGSSFWSLYEQVMNGSYQD
jgi:hypothetical protein